jgi:hypothetical protein
MTTRYEKLENSIQRNLDAKNNGFLLLRNESETILSLLSENRAMRELLMNSLAILDHEDDCMMGAYKNGCYGCDLEKRIRTILNPESK